MAGSQKSTQSSISSTSSEESLTLGKRRSRRTKHRNRQPSLAWGKHAKKGSNLRCKAHANLKGRLQLSVGPSGLVEMIDIYDRPGQAFATGDTYADAETYADAFEDKPGKRIPKAGAYAGAGVGHARAEWSIFDAEAKGPNASAGVEASAASLGVRAFAKAELASASATAGPVKVSVGLAADIGIGVGLTGVEAKVLGTGFSFGRKMGVSMFGSGIEFSLW